MKLKKLQAIALSVSMIVAYGVPASAETKMAVTEEAEVTQQITSAEKTPGTETAAVPEETTGMGKR